MIRTLLLFFILTVHSVKLCAETANIAVASNFIGTMTALVDRFSANSSHTIRVSFGSSGKLYAQIRQGAPFDIFLSADQSTPKRLVSDGLAQASSQYTYAQGQLVLWTALPDLYGKEKTALESGIYRLALANPRLAPYGVAAIEALENLGLEKYNNKNRVEGENIGQAFQFVYSKNAELGLVSASQLKQLDALTDNGDRPHPDVVQGWLLPQSLYNPIYQDAVRLNASLQNKAADAFWGFLKSSEAKAIIRQNGYLVSTK